MVCDICLVNKLFLYNQFFDWEYQVFNMLVSGLGLSEIGCWFFLSVKMISIYKMYILEKMSLFNIGDFICYVIVYQLVEVNDF